MDTWIIVVPSEAPFFFFFEIKLFHTEKSCLALPGISLHTMYTTPAAVASLINIPFYPHPVLTSQMNPVKIDAVGVGNMY